MPLIWGAVIAATGSAVSSGISANAKKKEAEALNESLDVAKNAKDLGYSLDEVYGRPIEAPEFNFGEGDILRITESLAKFNAGKGTDLANQSASKVNANTLNDLEAGMKRLFGGGDAFDNQRSKTNKIVEDQLDGKLSQSTRRLLARRSLASGASGVGEGAVDDLFAGYLGQTTEGIVQQGQQNYKSLYGLYRQSFPLVTGRDQMPFTTTAPAQGVQIGLQAAIAKYQADVFSATQEAAPDPVASGLLGDNMAREGAVIAANSGAAQMQAQAIGDISSSAGAAYSGYQSQKQSNQRWDDYMAAVGRGNSQVNADYGYNPYSGGTGNTVGGF